MKICILSPNFHSSIKRFPDRIFAPRTFAVNLVNGLKKKGHTVYFASAPDIETSAEMIGGDKDLLYQPRLKIDRYLTRSAAPSPALQGGVKKRRSGWLRLSSAECPILSPSIHSGSRVKSRDKLRPSGRRVEGLTRLCLTETEEFTVSWTRRQYYELDLIEKTISMAGKVGFDIIHTDYPLVHFFEEFSKIPIVYTLHDRLPYRDTLDYWILSKFRQHKFIAISDTQKIGLLPLNFVGTVFHGIDLQDYPFNPDTSGKYLAFIGRLIPDKGAHNAVKVANELKLNLHIATEPVYKENIYFKKEIEPYMDGGKVNVLGFLIGRKKVEFYQNARLVLFPIEWEEPFGLVMIEAMACGTPVVAFSRGSVVEVVKDGVTGFIVNSSAEDRRGDFIVKKTGIEGLIEAAGKISSMTHEEYKKMQYACRKHIEANFTMEKMVEGYERVYKKVLL